MLLGELPIVVGRVHRAAGNSITGRLELGPQALEVLSFSRSAARAGLRVEPEHEALRARRRRERDGRAVVVFSDEGRRGVAASQGGGRGRQQHAERETMHASRRPQKTNVQGW